MRKLTYAIGTVLGLGYSPIAPGTIGSVPPLLLFWLIPSMLEASPWFAVKIGVLIASAVLGWAVSYFIEKWEGSEDPGKIVIDEFAGQWICLSFIPHTFLVDKPWLILLGFLLFRFFDIRKPYPIRALEKWPKGLGVMADDMLSGLISGLLLWGLCLFLRS